LEATAFQVREIVEAMQKDGAAPLTSLRVDGGMVHNELLMQIQADQLGVPVIRPKVAETTSLGVAYAAGLAVGFWKDQHELLSNWQQDKVWMPLGPRAEHEKLYSGWKKAVTRTFDWAR
jgi:glycerol kinase